MVYDIALNVGIFAGVDNMLRFEIGQSIKGLERGGFKTLWEQQYNHFSWLKAMKWASMRVASPYISANTWSPFFSVVGVTLVLLRFLFVAELTYARNKK